MAMKKRNKVSSNLSIMDDLIVVLGGANEYHRLLIELVIIPRVGMDMEGLDSERYPKSFDRFYVDKVSYFDTMGEIFMISVKWGGYSGVYLYMDTVTISLDDFLILLKSYNRDLILGSMFNL